MEEKKKRNKETVKHYLNKINRTSALIIAHRGAKNLAKVENTMEAFQIAIDLKIKMVEFDVRKTKDGKLIVFHNDHINNIKLATLTYESLCEQTQLEHYHPPLLEDVLKICTGNIMLDIELKEAGYEAEILALLNKYITPDCYIITTFLDCVIQKIKLINPSIQVGLLIGLEKASFKQRISEFFPVKRLKKTHADLLVANYRLVTPWLIHHCKKHGYDLYVWTVNADSLYSKLIKQKVSGIITDHPERYDGQYFVS